MAVRGSYFETVHLPQASNLLEGTAPERQPPLARVQYDPLEELAERHVQILGKRLEHLHHAPLHSDARLYSLDMSHGGTILPGYQHRKIELADARRDYISRMPVTAASSDERLFVTTDQVRDLVAGFEATTLPYARWDHSAHLTVCAWYVLWYGPDAALDIVRTGIKRYNAAHSHMPQRVGYHETLTRFWFWAVREYVSRNPVRCSIADLMNGLVTARRDRDLPFRFYTRDHLMSQAARTGWVEPDVRPLDGDVLPGT